MLPIDDILAYLGEFQLESLTTEIRNRLYLACSLAKIAPAVELYGQPEVPSGYDSRRFIPGERQWAFLMTPGSRQGGAAMEAHRRAAESERGVSKCLA